MTAPIELWQLLAVLLTVCGVITGPTIWYTRANNARLEAETEKTFNRLDTSNNVAFKGIKDDLKDFRTHFDSKISEVYVAVDSKNRELKDFVSKELDFIKAHVTSVEQKVYETRERGHEIEKDLLKLQSLINKDYITREDMYNFIRNKKTDGS